MHQVLLHLETPVTAQVATDGSRRCRRRVGRACQRTEALNDPIAGDADFAAVEPIVGAITPVPGGVGTVTTSVLMAHVVEAAKRAAARA